MGPRIFIRGYSEDGRTWYRWRALQWGRGFSSADTEGDAMRDETRLGFNGAADFHPRIPEAQWVLARQEPASMGPRIFIRGYPISSMRLSKSGRFNGAADFHPRIQKMRKKTTLLGQLQWGRGFSSADTGPGMGPGANPQRFNGAADFHPRIRLGGSTGQARHYASMGPRIFIRGYTTAPTSTSWPWRFNGAADFHPRIPRILSAIRPDERLQWGRGFSSADTSTREHCTFSWVSFNGAADFHPRIQN